MARNARFWTFVNSAPVKLTLRPGQTLAHVSGGPTDEGWHREANVWRHEGDFIVREATSDGCDCDGRLTRYSDCECAIADLGAGYACAEDGVTYPAWDVRDASQRDYSAEAMGY